MPEENPKEIGDNSIFVGGKPFMNYVTGVVMQFTTKNADEVVVKARGKFISRAVDVAEIVRNRFLPEVSVREIKIGTEELPTADGRTANTSTIEIILEKP